MATRSRNQAELDRQVRFRIYEHFTAFARAPDARDLAAALSVPPSAIEESLERLASAHAIALAPGTHNIWMAHPFSAVPTPYPVRTAGRTYWANCAWDALGIPTLFEVDAEVHTQCADCGDPITLRVEDGRVAPREGVVHFAVPPKRFWENVGFT